MPHIAPRWKPEEKEAVGMALVDGGMTAKEAVRAASEGLLRAHGQLLEPFGPMPPSTALDCARKLRQRRAGRAASQVDKLPVRDVVEGVRLALARMLHGEIAAMERAKPGKRDLERIRQLARAAREVQALADKDAPAPPAPGANPRRNHRETSGLGGAILKAHRSGQTRVETRAAQEAHNTESMGDTGHARSEAQYEATHGRAYHREGERGEQQSEQEGEQPTRTLAGPSTVHRV